MANQKIVGYLREGINKGHSLYSLKQQLLKAGFQEHLINEAVYELKEVNTQKETQKNDTQERTAEPQENSSPTTEGISTEKQNIKEENLIEEVPGLDDNKTENPFKEPNKLNLSSKKNGIFWKMGKAIVAPKELFQSVKGEKIWSTLEYYLILLLIPFIISTIGTLFFIDTMTKVLRLISINFPPTGIVLTLIYIAIFATIIFIIIPLITFVLTGIFHLIIKLYRGKGTFADTFGIVAYSSTPSFLFIFFPIMPLWSLILNIIGISENHSISKLRAVLILLTPSIILAIAMAILSAFLPRQITVGQVA